MIKFSVITVCFNAVGTIELALKSVRAQTWGAVEHIVVDGASSDGTLEIVRRYDDRIAFVVSEKDNGIFDAMNKGVSLATGDVVYFLNADDSFVDDSVLADIAEAFTRHPEHALVYGNVLLKGQTNGVVNYPARPFRLHSISEFLHNSFCHQAVFVRRAMFAALGPFHVDYSYSADYEWIIRAFKAHGGRDFLFVERNIAYYYVFGRSQQYAAITRQEVDRMQRIHFLSLEYLWYFFRYVLVRRWKKRLLGESG